MITTSDPLPNFAATIENYLNGDGRRWVVPVGGVSPPRSGTLVGDVPAFLQEVDRLTIAATYWAVQHYNENSGRPKPWYFVMDGPFGQFTVPQSVSRDWWGALHGFTYWYVACVEVTGGVDAESGTRSALLTISIRVNVADYYKFVGYPRRERLRGQIDDDGDGGDELPLDWRFQFGARVDYPPVPLSLYWFRSSGPDAAAEVPPYITTKRFLNLHTTGLAREFYSAGGGADQRWDVRVR